VLHSGLIYAYLSKVQPVSSVPEDEHETEPEPKKARSSSLFGHWNNATISVTNVADRAKNQLSSYLDLINSSAFASADSALKLSFATLCQREDFNLLSPLFSRIFCVPASSAPVERIFSQSGLIMRPNRARMSDDLLESLVFLKCNKLSG
jgi:hypothetical protein